MERYSRRSALRIGGSLALLALAACGGETDRDREPARDGDPKGPGVELAADDPQASAYQAGSTAFALSMLAAAVANSADNAVISPLSIGQCLALVAQGAAGQTLTEIAALLGCSGAEELRAGANADITAVAALQKATFDMASTAFFDDSLKVEPAYEKTVQEYFGVNAHQTDFSDPHEATSQINGWVAERTHDKIPKLFGDGELSADTLAVLVNALYLKARWAETFDRGSTEEEKFTKDDGSAVTTDFMKDERTVPVAQSGDLLLMELPYEDDDLQALFLLPAPGQPIAQAVATLTPPQLDSLVGQLTETAAKLAIPPFEVRQRTELAGPLAALGMTSAFSEQDADFSALSSMHTSVSAVQHEAWLKVAERGTEGAAATGTGVAGAAPGGMGYPEIRFDRPFVFLVRVRSTGAIAFAAAIADPSVGR